MTNDPGKEPKGKKSKDALADSYRKETTSGKHAKNDKPSDKSEARTLTNRPVDPNATTSKVNIPPGITPEDAADPGRSTPGAPPVDNRSGQKK